MQLLLQFLSSLILEKYEFQECVDTNPSQKGSDEIRNTKEEDDWSKSFKVKISNDAIIDKPNSYYNQSIVDDGKFGYFMNNLDWLKINQQWLEVANSFGKQNTFH